MNPRHGQIVGLTRGGNALVWCQALARAVDCGLPPDRYRRHQTAEERRAIAGARAAGLREKGIGNGD